LSQWQKRLVTLIAAIAHRPRVLLLDEPTNALDPHRVAELKRYLTSTDAPEMTLISTHQLDFVANLTDQFLLLSEGHLAGTGTLNELRARFELEDGDLEQVVLHATKPR
jgi:ABC-2 type transport system ATP-binding protein